MDSNNGESGVEHLAVPMMTITVDPRTSFPSFKCTELPVWFWQNAVAEVQRQLEEQRRAASAIALRQQIEQQRADAAVAALVKKHPHGV